jgi:hypothetical protein
LYPQQLQATPHGGLTNVNHKVYKFMRIQPYYSLAKVRQLTASRKCIINSKARQTAKEHFGWSKADVLKALSKLQPKHF